MISHGKQIVAIISRTVAIGDTYECPSDIQEYPLDICVVPNRGHRKSALRSDGFHWGSYLVVGRYGRGRAARSIRSGIVGIQSWRSVYSDATKPDRISGSTTLSRWLIRDHSSVRHCGYGASIRGRAYLKSASEIAVPAEKHRANKNRFQFEG